MSSIDTNPSTPSPVVAFAQAMAAFQAASRTGNKRADTRINRIGMKAALEGVAGALDLSTDPSDRETLVCAVIARIEEDIEDSTKARLAPRRDGDPTHGEALTRAGEMFVDRVWPHLDRRLPLNELRDKYVGIYRVAFEQAHDRRVAERAEAEATADRQAMSPMP